MPRKPILKYDIVLSYSGQDRVIANQLYWVLKKRGFNVYNYLEKNQFGGDLNRLTREIYSSGASNAVVILSENYVRGPWTTKEWETLLKARSARKIKKLFLIRLDQATPPGLTGAEVYEVWRNNPREIGKKIIGQITTMRTRVLRMYVAIIILLCFLAGGWLYLHGKG